MVRAKTETGKFKSAVIRSKKSSCLVLSVTSTKLPLGKTLNHATFYFFYAKNGWNFFECVTCFYCCNILYTDNV